MPANNRVVLRMVGNLAGMYFVIVRVEVIFPLVGDDCYDVFDRLNFLRLELSQPVSVKERGSLGILASTEGGTRCGAGPAEFFPCHRFGHSPAFRN